MKVLTDQELKFLKETNWTPTLYQMDYKLNSKLSDSEAQMLKFRYNTMAKNYKVDIQELYDKLTEENDYISLEDEAVWLLYNFFTEEELKNHDNKFLLDWLQDFQYFDGYRKWSESDVMSAVNTVFEIYSGELEFYTVDDGSVGVKSKE